MISGSILMITTHKPLAKQRIHEFQNYTCGLHGGVGMSGDSVLLVWSWVTYCAWNTPISLSDTRSQIFTGSCKTCITDLSIRDTKSSGFLLLETTVPCAVSKELCLLFCLFETCSFCFGISGLIDLPTSPSESVMSVKERVLLFSLVRKSES